VEPIGAPLIGVRVIDSAEWTCDKRWLPVDVNFLEDDGRRLHRMAISRLRFTLADLLWCVAWVGLLVAWGVFAVKTEVGLSPRPGDLTTLVILVVAFVALVSVQSYLKAGQTSPTCSVCGRRFLAKPQPNETAVCPKCRQRSLNPEQLQKQQALGCGCIVVGLAAISVPSGLYYGSSLADLTGFGYWLAAPLATLISAFWLPTCYFVPFLLFLAAERRLWRNDRYVLSLARRTAGNEGTESRAGPITIWFSGPSDPVPVLREQFEIARGRLSALLGRQLQSESQMRIYYFDKSDAYVKFTRPLLPRGSSDTSVYFGTPRRLAAFSREAPPHRLGELKDTWAHFFYHFWLESAIGSRIPLWLGALVACVQDNQEDPAPTARNLRRMLQTIKSGRALDATDLFRAKDTTLGNLALNRTNYHNFTKLSHRIGQLRSVGEYLISATADQDRRTRFVAFLSDLKSKDNPEDVFRRHFGYGFDQLLQDWRVWVLDRGEAPHDPPPADILDALIHRVIPTIGNSQSPILDRVEAVRAMGEAGFVAGADSLIELLRNGTEIPREELVWALETISGLTLGDDPPAWADWWDRVPDAAKCPARVADGPEVGAEPNPAPPTAVANDE
jgi:DNA-directed RNA polymerase subunit RPC12/RpoP